MPDKNSSYIATYGLFVVSDQRTFAVQTNENWKLVDWHDANARRSYFTSKIDISDAFYPWFDRAVVRLVNTDLDRGEPLWKAINKLHDALYASRVVLPGSLQNTRLPIVNFLIAAERHDIFFTELSEVEKISRYLGRILKAVVNNPGLEMDKAVVALLGLCVLFHDHTPCLNKSEAERITKADVFIGAADLFCLFDGKAEPCQCLRVSARWPWVAKETFFLPLAELFGAERLDDLAELLGRGRIDRDIARRIIREPRVIELCQTLAELDPMLDEYVSARRPTHLLQFVELGGTRAAYLADKARRKAERRQEPSRTPKVVAPQIASVQDAPPEVSFEEEDDGNETSTESQDEPADTAEEMIEENSAPDKPKTLEQQEENEEATLEDEADRPQNDEAEAIRPPPHSEDVNRLHLELQVKDLVEDEELREPVEAILVHGFVRPGRGVAHFLGGKSVFVKHIVKMVAAKLSGRAGVKDVRRALDWLTRQGVIRKDGNEMIAFSTDGGKTEVGDELITRTLAFRKELRGS